MSEALDDYETGLLYLIIEDKGQTDFSFLKDLKADHGLASVLLTQASQATAIELMAACHSLDLPLLIEDQVELAQLIGADGVHLVNPKALSFARNALGDNAIVGVSCGPTRHEAMIVGEQEPDYILFGGYASDQDPTPVDPDLVTWWLEMMELPVVAMARSDEEAQSLRSLACDFVGQVRF